MITLATALNSIRQQAVSLTLVTVGVLACSHSPVVQEFPDTASPPDEVSRLSADMETAHGQQVAILSPTHFKKAQEKLSDSQSSLKDPKKGKRTLHHVAVGREYLRRANSAAAIARTSIEEVVRARTQALAAGAPAMFADDFKDADDRLRDVTMDLEQNDLDSSKEHREALQATYLALELRAIKHTQLDPAQTLLDQAVQEGAREYAPRSLAIAQKSLGDADGFITGDRHSDQVAARSRNAIQAAEHLLKITRAAKSGRDTSAEELALQMEALRNRTALEREGMQERQTQLAGQLAGSKAELTEAQEQAAAHERVQAERALFQNAQSQFSDEEADVYEQDGKLVIRLKGLEFPTSQSLLKGDNFALLAKVQRVIRDFGDSTVVVEGHSDSQGGKSANKKLSLDRAEAVRAYLVSSDAIDEDSITAIGHGFDQPLATNKTLAGRAQNRRVDILIQPDASHE